VAFLGVQVFDKLHALALFESFERVIVEYSHFGHAIRSIHAHGHQQN